jgi:hypothetical protein
MFDYRNCERCKAEYRPSRQAQSYCSKDCRRAVAYGRERFAAARKRRLEASDKLPCTPIPGSFRNGPFSSIETEPYRSRFPPIEASYCGPTPGALQGDDYPLELPRRLSEASGLLRSETSLMTEIRVDTEVLRVVNELRDVLKRERVGLAAADGTDRRNDGSRWAARRRGGYVSAVKGSYFGKLITIARQENRVTDTIAIDPLPELKAYWDLGVGDATAIWIAQNVGAAIHVIDFIEGVGQGLSFYVSELRSRGYDSALCVLPHDGLNRNNVTGHRFEDHLRDANFRTRIIENQGMGAAKQRIEAARRLGANHQGRRQGQGRSCSRRP